MKIMLISSYPVFGGSGGAEKVFWEMANEFSKRGDTVTAVGFEKQDQVPFFHVERSVKTINAGVKYQKNMRIKLKSLFYLNSEKRRIYRDLSEGKRKARIILPVLYSAKPDVVISFQMEMTYILKEIIQISCPVITMLHNDIETLLDGKERFYRALESCECIQVLMPSFVEKLKNYIKPKRIEHIPNIVPQYKKIINYNNKLIINVGRVEGEQKRQHLLIESFNRVKEKYPDWIVEIWGDIERNHSYFMQCTKLIKKYNLQNNIKFCGTTKKISEQLQRASLFAFPSAFEGFPLSLTEAMSMGLPAIGYKACPAVNELIEHGHNGYLCDNGIEEFAEALDRLMADKEKRYKFGINAKKDMEQYAPQVIWNKWYKLIDEFIPCIS